MFFLCVSNKCKVDFLTRLATVPENLDVRSQALDIFIILSMDARTDYLRDMASKTLAKILGDNDDETRQLLEHLYILTHTYNLIIEYTNDSQEPVK